MADKLTPERRSELMSRIRSKDTAPEWVVRRLLHAMGYRYRLHYGRLPGRPDVVFAGRRIAIFVHGCFWHRHTCTLASRPKSNSAYWQQKLEGNAVRDARAQAALREAGWKTLVVWECETRGKDLEPLARRLQEFIGPTVLRPSKAATSTG
jgi:DNA mismatch endonuclease (patch repair protein)